MTAYVIFGFDCGVAELGSCQNKCEHVLNGTWKRLIASIRQYGKMTKLAQERDGSKLERNGDSWVV